MCKQSAPDTSGMNAAAVQQAALSKEQLDWAKQLYGETAPDRAAATARANAVSDAQLTALQKQTAITDDYDKYNKSTFRPLEQRIVADANNFDTEGKREELAGKAMGDVQQGFNAAEQQQMRQQQRMGIDPNSGRALALGNELTTAKALGLSSAANKARTDASTLGYARKMDAASLGRGLASAQATSAGLAVNQGNASSANARAGGDITAQGESLMSAGYGGAQAGLNGAANTYGNIANIQQRADDNSGSLGALGSVGGALISKYSDKNLKEGRKKISGKASLAQVKRLPSNESWRYKDGNVASDGGKTHQGHMAQDVNRVMGEGAAPGGRIINLETMASTGLAAIKEVAKTQSVLAKRIKGLESARGKAPQRA